MDIGSDRASEILINRPEQTIGLESVTVGSVDAKVCYGRVFLYKRSTGDTIYVTFGSQQPSDKNYNVILTDTFPIFDDAVVIGDIRAIGTASTGILSTYARGGFWK